MTFGERKGYLMKTYKFIGTESNDILNMECVDYDTECLILGGSIKKIKRFGTSRIPEIKKIVIQEGTNIKEIEKTAFQGTPIEKEILKKNNKMFVLDRVLYYAQDDYEGEDLVISENIISIRPFAFEGFKTIKSVVIPSNVALIYSGAFSGSAIEKITIANGVECLDDAFEGCMNLKSVIIPPSVKSADQAFKNCKNLESAIIQSEVLESAIETFRNCLNLSSVIINPKLKIGNGGMMFNNCFKLENINMGNVETISSGMFSNCKKLRSIIINNVKEIDSYAFLECKELINIAAPKLEKIHTGAFMNSGIDTSIFNTSVFIS